jgi:hypothetical protein
MCFFVYSATLGVMRFSRAHIRRLAHVLLHLYVIGIGTLLAPPLLFWLFFSGHRPLAWALVLLLPCPMLLVVLSLDLHDRLRQARRDN